MPSGLVALFTSSDLKIFLTFGIEKDISDNLARISYSKGGKEWFSAPDGCVHWLVRYWFKMAAFTHGSVRETPFSINGGIEVHTLSPVTWRTVFHHSRLGMSELLNSSPGLYSSWEAVFCWGQPPDYEQFWRLEVCIRSWPFVTPPQNIASPNQPFKVTIYPRFLFSANCHSGVWDELH